MYIFQLVKTSGFILRFFKKQKRYNQQFIPVYLQPFYLQYKQELLPATLKKIHNYYCLGVPATCAIYAGIYGKKLTTDQRKLATLAGILTPLIDNFTDHQTLSAEALDRLTTAPERFHPLTLEEAIVKDILCILLQKVSSPHGFLKALKDTIQAQHRSALQMQPETALEKLLEISTSKGGYSHIFFHYLIEEIPTQETIDTLYQMGGMLQLSNDIFDVYKDHQEGIATYANRCPDYTLFEQEYLRGCRKYCKMARSLPYPAPGIQLFTSFFGGVMGRGLVALQMLKKLQQQTGCAALPLDQLQRSQLICDMEKPGNKLQTVRHTYRVVARKSSVGISTS